MGLVHAVVPTAQLDEAVNEKIAQLTDGGPNAHREIKALFANLEVGDLSEATLALTANTIARVRGTDEARQGFAAFLEKRPAPWTIGS
jgi:methylglutaconyl-CoA hydratase